MSVSLRALIELILLGPIGNRRQLQDSPILGDVWIAYANKPSDALDLLITPYKNQPAGPVAAAIVRGIDKLDDELDIPRGAGQAADVAYLNGFVAARLFFQEVLIIVVPKTSWWQDRKVGSGWQSYTPDKLRPKVEAIIKWIQSSDEGLQTGLTDEFADFSPWDRYAVLAGVILWAGRQKEKSTESGVNIADLVARITDPNPIIEEIDWLLGEIKKHPLQKEKLVWQVSLNRKVMPAVEKSVLAVKGDAAKTLFNVRCDEIRWGVLDSGIDGTHPVFRGENGESRIIQAFDFSNIRKIFSLDNLNTKTSAFKQRVSELRIGREEILSEKEATKILKELANDADNDRPIHWEAVERLIKVDPTTPPHGGHGTHVAGIIGANSRVQKDADGKQTENMGNSSYMDGMCPDIKLYDFRVLANSLEDTEFAIIAALQYIRYMNERHAHISVHGVNLSLSIPHDVRNFACGRTPVCNECEHLVESGVVVVAAAGNLGYQSFETREGSYEGYTAFSITDPGNADGVITVGATHRYRPHTYGVSFFSSRGPTGDGRMKPDLVAPGERIQSCLPDDTWGELDGTSMAAPHVSGAAAMLMARYPELIGNPRRIKTILCESATDLGRDRSFQGHGMLDVLRAFQSI
jgi:serine protease AprX